MSKEPKSRSAEKMAREDAHYFVVKGRRWRKTDPDIPEKLRAELVKELMAARRVKTAQGCRTPKSRSVNGALNGGKKCPPKRTANAYWRRCAHFCASGRPALLSVHRTPLVSPAVGGGELWFRKRGRSLATRRALVRS